MKILLVFLGGGLGSLARYLMYLLTSGLFAYAQITTLLVNVLGCLLIGIVYSYLQKLSLEYSYIKDFIITGFLGGFTTFSTFSLDFHSLIQGNKLPYAILYVILSITLGLSGFLLGTYLTKISCFFSTL